MPYDDIRFSHWDDPDDESSSNDDEFYEGEFDDDGEFYASWDEPMWIVDDEEIYIAYESECVMCGRERGCNNEGYCSQCWQIWNS